MDAKAGWCTPMLHVAQVERSIRFYRLLGFELVDIEGEKGCPPGWARMSTADGSAIMFLLGEDEHAVKPEEQGIMLVLYTPELPALREQLVAAGERPTTIERPPWMPSGHMMIRDPDGYAVGVNQWGDGEHRAWLEEIARKRAGGIVP
jgi:catechol 2,3-dioxygenase-like lactoylglutathione lyase family enzyme